jgi:heme-binding protein
MAQFRIKTALLVLVALLVAIQLVPIRRDNPPVTAPIKPPKDVEATLRRSCFDCHSHETVWPWYSYVAPVSWLVAHDVHEGRRHMDFSAWADYSIELKRKKLAGISELVQEREMPLWYYLPMHRNAQLSDDDVSVIAMWADNSSGGED